MPVHGRGSALRRDGYSTSMTTAPNPSPEPDPPQSEPAPDPGPIKPSGGDEIPTIEPDPGDVDRTAENPDSVLGGLAGRDAAQDEVDREMADGTSPADRP